MVAEERRQYMYRPESLNLVYFAVFKPEKNISQQGMGRTLNISLGGILLETYKKISESGKIVLSLGFKDDTLEVEAEIAHCIQKDNGTFHTGLSFKNVDKNASEQINRYINLFKKLEEEEPLDDHT